MKPKISVDDLFEIKAEVFRKMTGYFAPGKQQRNTEVEYTGIHFNITEQQKLRG